MRDRVAVVESFMSVPLTYAADCQGCEWREDGIRNRKTALCRAAGHVLSRPRHQVRVTPVGFDLVDTRPAFAKWKAVALEPLPAPALALGEKNPSQKETP